MQFGMRVEGFDELARALNALPEAVGAKTMREALKAAADPIAGTAAALMRRSADAPHAADNVVVQVGRSGHTIAIGPRKSKDEATDFYYWLFQELGTRFHGPQPAMRPAFDTQAPTALGIMGRELWKAIRGEAERNTRGVGGRFR